jgi:ABC-type lipoprotein release transport system permease subunit
MLLRGHLRATFALALLISVGGSAAIAAATAARRTDSAYPRFLQKFRGADLFVVNFNGESGLVPPEAVAATEGVAVVEPVRWAMLNVDGQFVASLVRSQDPASAPVDRVKIIAGRAADPRNPGEAVASMLGFRQGLTVGRTFRLATFTDTSNGEFDAFAKAIAEHPLEMTIVGVAAAPGGFPPQVQETAFNLYLTPAFYRRYPNALGVADSSLVRVQPGVSSDAFRSRLQVKTGGLPPTFFDRRGQDANVQRSIHLQALALWLLAGIAGLVVALIVAQGVARTVFLESDDAGVLSALGLTRSQLFGSSILRASVTGAVGALIGCGISVLLSPLAPIGIARRAEPAPGFALDFVVLGIGACAVIALACLSAAIPAWRSARDALRSPSSDARPSAATEALARAGLGASGVLGLRFALERGRGRTAVPVFSTIFGLAVALLTLTATIVFASSMNRLTHEPRLYGVTWDMTIGDDSGFDTQKARAIAAIPGVRAVAIGNVGLDMLVNDKPVQALAISAVVGSVPLSILEGRAPAAADEAVAGSRTMRRLGLRIGDRVRMRAEGTDAELEMRIVGRGVVPAGTETNPPGDGVLVPLAAFLRIGEIIGISDFAPGNGFLRLDPGVSRHQIRQRLVDALEPGTEFGQRVYEYPIATPSDIASFGGVRNLPYVLGGFLGLLSAATLVHTLMTAIRRRRRDLAVVKALGFVRGQARLAVAWQATALAIVSCAAGLPAGVAAGRWAWQAFTSQLGVVPAPDVAVWVVLVTLAGTVVVANLIALGPAAAAARTRPAEILRAE